MKPRELLIIGIDYIGCVSLVYIVAKHLNVDAAGMAQAGGTISAVGAFSALYQVRTREIPPMKERLVVGALLAPLALIQGIAFQMIFKWMPDPDISIPAGVLGAFFLPLLVGSLFGGTISKTRKN